ncbi:MAG: glycosyltransferase family 2 protein [Chloroflexota bacterium]|nr:glycosyltransferase family 2 protein [Chloroflexota bacterium]
MTPQVSAVIITYNSRRDLSACLESLRRHTTGVEYEVIVADNASSDGTPDVIAERYPWVRLLRRGTNDGLSAAINDGVRASTAAYVAVLNPDTRIDGDVLTPMAQYLREHADAGIVAPKLLNEDGSLQLSCRAFPGYATVLFNRYSLITKLLPRNRLSSRYLMSDFDHSTTRDVDWVSGAAIMMPRRVFDEVGGWDSGFFMFNEDVDLCRRVHDAGYRVVYKPDVAVYHKIGASQSTSPRMVIERNRSIWRYYTKHLRGGRLRDVTTAAGIVGRCGLLLASNEVRRVLARRRKK